ncbi:MAG: hypothetical protein A2913_01180 [Parcubacteria group bacterium RIFCSPLOWO2_01_FULL_40_65]|nr:MAG: hypothetical protein A2734_00825 [Parcubacteria group bacterium RIFCSPHIGHO2_01_FULL_40_30]OHB19497.1 MAG: hypothetical protein A3D40_02545 [Parcubacteria group bacterium RIFCSPHIGHO2_02_FULL_40_12]OHB22100.1 MAG: hypothetical protein A2913_01180 [Parcubacteria group bacterium RIFCSPLOWO2_01_FULL_40_65]OHB23695.1 MAG: hypothetical protein A3I22_02580 [Parcubacteria group bacterium RIFCSPLOWO2_02_FULL_40_12]OHB24392.1 MAG: hypothetical protein A3F96_00770 [Parcubacteria group bacterium R
MDSIFAKTIFLFASLLTVLTGADYVKISSDSLTYDFRTGDHAPIYYFLNTENAGIKKVRFDVTSFSDWVSVYKEGDNASAKTSLELAQYSPLNFILEVRPERLSDGVNKAKVTVEAVDLQDYSVLDLKEVIITVNKNLKEEAIPFIIETPKQIISPTPAPILILTPTPFIPSFSLPKLSPVKTPFLPLSPSPALSPEIEISRSVLKQIQSTIDSIKLFLKKLF